MWTIRHQTPETVEVVLALHSAQFTKRNVICNLSATSVTAGMRGVPGANGSPDTVILQGQWAGAIVADESSWTLEEGKLVLDIRKRVDADWKILICSGINGDDSLIDPLSRVIIGVAAEQSNDHALALKCYERSAQEGSWHAMRKLAALYSPNSDDTFPNVVKDVKTSISYVQMGAQQSWNRCYNPLMGYATPPCVSHSCCSDAQFILAHAYSSGFGVPMDNVRSIELLQQAAAFGQHPYAMFELAENLLRGQHIAPDPARAVQLLQQSSSLGHTIAMWTLGQLFVTGSDGVQRDMKQGVAHVAAALKADPTLTKKVFAPYTNPARAAAALTTVKPSSSTMLDTIAEDEMEKNSSHSASRVPLYAAAAAVVGVAALATLVFFRMRRK